MARSEIRRESLIPEAKGRRRDLQGKAEYYDYSLLAVIILLTSFGLIMLYSTSAYMAQIDWGDDMYYFKKQAIISFVCIFVALVISQIDYHLLAFFVTPIYGLAAGTMFLVKTPFGVVSHGARRWLKIGPIQFQPAEIAKIAVIVTMAYMIVFMGRKVKTLRGIFILGGSGAILGGMAYIFTDNLSTAIIIFGITAGMLFLAHPNLKLFLGLAAAGAAAIALFVLILVNTVKNSSSFRVRRILVWLHPEDFAKDEGYQTMQSLYAIGSGGFLGRGLGNSIQKLGSVPEAQNDMIFSIICEELGVLGGLFVVGMFAYLMYRLFFIAQNAPDMFGSLLVSGVLIHIALQVILNIAVVVNLLPNTGVSLPFISYGGTSILFLMSEMGLALSVSRRIVLKETERLL